MTKALKNVGTSVRAKLLQLAKQRGDDFQLVLLRYVNERLLYRLASSAHANKFVLKGAALFTLWTGQPHRATRDIDLLGFGDASEGHVRHVFDEIVSASVADDGVIFDRKSLDVGPIREDQEYGGIRITLNATVAEARVRLQIDVGFGDAITPEAIEVDFPVLLASPAPRLRAYPRETVVAEKLDAMVQLGLANSRMKDFYDLQVLSELFDFDGALLAEAIRATFRRRNTPLPDDVPVALTQAFADDPTKKQQWSAFVSKSGAPEMGELSVVVSRVARFATAPLSHARLTSPWRGHWSRGGPWSP
jgi:predicted nucleotidyltransferase component of viral defense system